MKALVPTEVIEQKILLIQGEKVLLDIKHQEATPALFLAGNAAWKTVKRNIYVAAKMAW